MPSRPPNGKSTAAQIGSQRLPGPSKSQPLWPPKGVTHYPFRSEKACARGCTPETPNSNSIGTARFPSSRRWQVAERSDGVYQKQKCPTFMLLMRVLRVEKCPRQKSDTPSDLRWTMDNGHMGEGRSTSPMRRRPGAPPLGKEKAALDDQCRLHSRVCHTRPPRQVRNRRPDA